MICDNVLKYVTINKDGSIVAVYHETANNEAVRVLRPATKPQPTTAKETAVSEEVES